MIGVPANMVIQSVLHKTSFVIRKRVGFWQRFYCQKTTRSTVSELINSQLNFILRMAIEGEFE